MLNRKSAWLVVYLAVGLAMTGCFGHKKTDSQTGAGNSAEPDKVLFERADNDIKHGRYDIARLTLQTLINTYPDSEYLAKAKLEVADSYYKEGGTSGMTQAVAEYQDFITFFPFLDEAAYAQMQIGMTHYRRMEKPDRDRNEALEAEAAFQTYIEKYPTSELTPQVQQRLREVQEVLAGGDFQVASFYYLRRVDRAAAARLTDLVNRYPLFSEADQANWMLGSIYERTEHSDVAAQYYTRIVRDYPLSPLSAEAKAKLTKFNVPVPQADPTAVARMQKEQQMPRARGGILSKPMGLLKTGPDVSMAARVGAPSMTPESDDSTDTLTPGGSLTVGASGGSGGAGAAGNSAYVETVSPGSGAGSAAASPSTAQPVAGQSSTGQSGSDPSQASTTSSQDSGAASSSTSGTSSQADASTDPTQSPASTDPKQESSSKKKKGLAKLNPF
jgi:outer membrane protein assembly factor BamD